WRRRAPPPDITMPLSMMSDDSSGGVCSRTDRTAATSCWSGCSMASITSDDGVGVGRGRAARGARPRPPLVRPHPGRRERDGARQTGDEVAAAHLHRQLALEWERGADLHLDFFGRPLADHEVVFLADVGRDRLV